MEEFGCPYCWDARKRKEKDILWFFDAANNLRECDYCPKCGQKLDWEEKDDNIRS